MTINHIYLSPHLDDAVFSCGGLIREQCARGESVHVVTVFTASPKPEQLSDFERLIYSPGRQHDVFSGSRADDTKVMNALGATFEYLNYNIAMHRFDKTGQPLYPGIRKYTGISLADAGIFNALKAKFHALRTEHPGATIYAPLGVGGHVDHLIVNTAAHALAGPVRFYEDFPYVLFGRVGPLAFRWLKRLGQIKLWRPFDHPDARSYPLTWPLVCKAFQIAPFLGGPDYALRQNGHGAFRWQPTLHPIDLDKKIEHALYYGDQITLLFARAENLCNGLRLYARTLSRRTGMDIPYERTWQPVG